MPKGKKPIVRFAVEEEFQPFQKSPKKITNQDPKPSYAHIFVPDVLHSIFGLLDKKCLIRVTLVCKGWRECAFKMFQDLPDCPSLPKNKAIASVMWNNFFDKETAFFLKKNRTPIPEEYCHWGSITSVLFAGDSFLSASEDRFSSSKLESNFARSIKQWNENGVQSTFIDFPSKARKLKSVRPALRRPTIPNSPLIHPNVVQYHQGKLLVSFDHKLQLYDLASGSMLFDVAGVSTLGRLTPDGSRLIMCSNTSLRGSNIQIMDSATMEVLDSFPATSDSHETVTALACLDTVLAYGTSNGECWVVSGFGEERTSCKLPEVHQTEVTHLCFSDGKYLISGSQDRNIHLHDFIRVLCTKRMESKGLLANTITGLYADEWRMIVSMKISGIRLYDRRVPFCPEIKLVNYEKTQCMDVNGFRMVTGHPDSMVKVWDWRWTTCPVEIFGTENNIQNFDYMMHPKQ